MNKPPFDHQTITAYLLGALPEGETEALDELTFTDDRFAEALDAAEKDLVDAYARGELSGATLENFRNYYLASPLRREKVKFAETFQAFAGKRVAETGAPASAVEESERKGFFAGLRAALRNLGAPRGILPYGLAAAALLLMVLGGWLLFENNRLSE